MHFLRFYLLPIIQIKIGLLANMIRWLCVIQFKSQAQMQQLLEYMEKKKAIALSVDSSANYCKSHPITGGKQIVCENWRNLISVGAKPLAITNCLNFGSPENEEVMGEFAECLLGIKEACEFLDYPVVSGNVSFYNGTNKKEYISYSSDWRSRLN